MIASENLEKIIEITGTPLKQLSYVNWNDDGYVLDASGDIIELSISNSAFANSIAPSLFLLLGSFKNLKKLHLDGVNLTNLEGIEYLSNLSYLNLSNNSIEYIYPLGNLKHLTHVNLTNNGITDITPLKNLANLKELLLRGNNIIDYKGLKNLRNLDYLSASGTLKNLKEVNTIKSLELHHIDKEAQESFSHLLYLTNLSIGNSNLKDLSFLRSLKTITDLSLIDNDIEDTSVAFRIDKVL